MWLKKPGRQQFGKAGRGEGVRRHTLQRTRRCCRCRRTPQHTAQSSNQRWTPRGRIVSAITVSSVIAAIVRACAPIAMEPDLSASRPIATELDMSKYMLHTTLKQHSISLIAPAKLRVCCAVLCCGVLCCCTLQVLLGNDDFHITCHRLQATCSLATLLHTLVESPPPC